MNSVFKRGDRVIVAEDYIRSRSAAGYKLEPYKIYQILAVEPEDCEYAINDDQGGVLWIPAGALFPASAFTLDRTEFVKKVFGFSSDEELERFLSE